MKWNTLTDLIRQKKNVFHLEGRSFEVFQSEKKKERGRRKVKGRIRLKTVLSINEIHPKGCQS